MLEWLKKQHKKEQIRRQSFDEEFLKDNERQNSRIIEVECIEERPCYDSTWLIHFENNGVSGVVKIVRYDTEQKHSLCHALDNLSSFTEDTIMSLDKKSCIYYD